MAKKMTGRDENNAKYESQIESIVGNDEFMRGYNEYFSYVKVRQPSSRRTSLYTIREYLDFVRDKGIEMSWQTISRKAYIGEYLKTKEKYTFSWRHGILYALKQFFSYAVKEGFLEKNPADDFEIESGEDVITRPEVTRKDLQKALRNVEKGVGSDFAKAYQEKWFERDYLIILILSVTGIRVSALVSINADDIYCEDGKMLLVIRDKGNRVHTFDVTNLEEYISVWLEKREKLLNGVECDALFISNRRTRICQESISLITYKYAGCSPHDIRSGVVTSLLMGGFSINETSAYIGHKNIATTLRYDRRKESIKTDGANRMTSILNIK